MKRTMLAIIALLSLVMGFAQLQNFFPLSVQRFMDERADRERMTRIGQGHVPDVFKSQYSPSQLINGIEMIDAFIDIDNHDAIARLRKQGVIVNCEFDDFVTAQVPVSMLDKVNSIPGVKGIEISKLVELCTDSTLSVTHAGQVLNGPDYGLPQAYDGSDVVIGIIDAGFDYQHLAFRNANDQSQTRIKRVYDAMNETGHPVYVGGNQLPGSVFMNEQIDTMRYDTNGTHGTHTAGIAAGMHVNGYGGMAPGADIVLCSVRYMDMLINETSVINAMKYIYSYADSVGKPCVISLSISSHQGPHDGNDRLSKAIASCTGPGHIFVISAGNNGYANRYAYGAATVNNPVNMLWTQIVSGISSDGSYYYPDVWMDTWVRTLYTRALVQFHIFDKNTRHIVWKSDLISLYKKIDSSEFSQFYGPNTSVDSVGYLSAVVSQTSSGKYEIQCYAHNLISRNYTLVNGSYNSRYQIGVSFYPPSLVYPRQPDSCYIDSWVCMGARGAYSGLVYIDEIDDNGDTISTKAVEGFYRWPSDRCSMNTYAIHDSIISAGAFVGKNSYYAYNNTLVTDYPVVGSLYVLSSYQGPGFGPTGKHLPTVMAPGYIVTSAGSRYSYFKDITRNDLVMRTSDGSLWGAMSGTSMAAPTVAGIIAQWLQIKPDLSPSQVKDIIAQTAIKDAFTQSPDNGSHFGPNGKIDAMAGVKYLLSQMEDEILLGDVNGDGFVNIKDVTKLITYLLNPDSVPEIVIANADINQDGMVIIKDVTLLINLLLRAGF